jgi:hypothetical protein
LLLYHFVVCTLQPLCEWFGPGEYSICHDAVGSLAIVSLHPVPHALMPLCIIPVSLMQLELYTSHQSGMLHAWAATGRLHAVIMHHGSQVHCTITSAPLSDMLFASVRVCRL